MFLLQTLLFAASVGSAVYPATVTLRVDDSLRVRIERRVAMVPGAEVGVAFRDLARGNTLFLGADVSFHAASTMKVPVMIELFRRVDAGALRLDQGLLLVNRF